MPPRVLAVGLTPKPIDSWRPLPAGIGVNPAPQSGAAPPPETAGAFTTVGRSRKFPREAFWSDSSDGLLFLFHLHGFEDLAAYAASAGSPAGDEFWAAVVESWLADHSIPSRPAWHPYPTSLRLISWSAALSGVEGWDEALKARLAGEVRREALYLRRSIEHDIGGNHVLKNGCALAISGVLVEDAAIRDYGLALLKRELQQQILDDGGHEERSTSYHRIVLNDLEDVRFVLEDDGTAPSWLTDTIESAARWRDALVGPDGRLPLLNDAWEGPPLDRKPHDDVIDLRATGYIVLRHDSDQAVFDVGQLCPPHLPPHGHADALSFVLWADGAPLIVDPGSGAYAGPLRDRFRATAAHNTVEVDDENQCELWSDFRLAGLPTVWAGVPLTHPGGVTTISCSHDGYTRLPAPVVHQRIFAWCPGDGLVVIDRLVGKGRHSIRSRLHLAPGIAAGASGKVGPLMVRPLGDGEVAPVDDLYSPHLGVTSETKALQLKAEIDVNTIFGWTLLRSDGKAISVTPTEVVVERSGQAQLRIPLDWN